MWIFLSILVICIAVIVYKFIDESCSIDLFEIEKRLIALERCIYNLVEILKEGEE